MLAYFDCFSGISGAMVLGALIHLGVPLDLLQDRLRGILAEDFDLTATPVRLNGIQAIEVAVRTHGTLSARNLDELRTLIEDCRLPQPVKSQSLKILAKHSEADAPPFAGFPAEMTAIDVVIETVGTAICLNYLGIDAIFASRLPLGRGFVTGKPARFPVPTPATLNMLKGVPVYGSDIPCELVTLSGAAIITALSRGFGAMPGMTLDAIGYGAGPSEHADRPHLLRIITGTALQAEDPVPAYMQEDCITVIETCIDDMNSELFGYLMERLFTEGALDVYWIPVHMKKNRPGTMVQVLCRADRREVLIRRILSETTTLGVRHFESRRRLLWRDRRDVKTSFGVIPVKCIKDPDGISRISPEYEVCRKIARERNLPLRSVYDTIAREARVIE